MTNHDELCEKVLPNRSFVRDYDVVKTALLEALTQGILIPAEKMLTVEEIRLAVLSGFIEAEKLINPLDRLTYGDECHVIALVVQKIHAQMTGGGK